MVFKAKVVIIMGSQSDYICMKDAETILEELKIPYETKVVSAHRTPNRMYEFAKKARIEGYEVIIAGAGGAAHLPGMVASLTSLPVIGVPVKSAMLNGVDSLLSIAQMPFGVPVATMAIGGSKNAALFAARILALSDKNIQASLEEWQKDHSNGVAESVEK